MRSLMAAVALLAAGAVGLMTAEAQPGRAPAKLSELKQAELVQREFNRVADGLTKLGKVPVRGRANSAISSIVDGKSLLDNTAWRDVVTSKVVKLNGKGVTVQEVAKVQKEVNRRFDAIRKAGKLTILDRSFLSGLERRDLQAIIRCGIAGTFTDCSRIFVDRKKGG
jgi:hypothetical protein